MAESQVGLVDAESHRAPRLPTLPAAVIQILLCLGQIALVFLLPAFYSRNGSFGAFSLLIYSHSGHWAAFLLIDQFLLHHHHVSRQRGYLQFYVLTKNVRRAPFYILSVGNAVLMTVVVILHDLCVEDCRSSFTRVDYLRGLITLESLVVMCLVANYLYLLAEFHASSLPPDVLREEVYPITTGHADLVGSLEPHQVKEVMERQAEMIRYLQERCEDLCGKIQELAAQLGRKERLSSDFTV